MIFTNFTIVLTFTANCARLRSHRILKILPERFFFIINWSLRNNYLRIIWLLSLEKSALKIEKSWNVWKSWPKFFLNCEITGDLTNVPSSMFYHTLKPLLGLDLSYCIINWKSWPDISSLSTTFYDLSVSCNLFSKSEMRQKNAYDWETGGLIDGWCWSKIEKEKYRFLT